MDSARDPALEQQLISQPDDRALKLVYGDWLQAHGDVWGELIVQQQDHHDQRPLFEWDDPAGWKHAVRQHPINNELYHRFGGDLGADETVEDPNDLATHLRTEILGGAGDGAGDDGVRLRWRHGFVDKVFIPQRVSWDTTDLDIVVGELLTHRCCLLLTELALGAVGWRTDSQWGGRSLHYQPEIEAIAAYPPPCLKRLVLGAWEEHDVSWTAVGDLSPLYPVVPQLTALEIQGNDVDFGDVQLPHLRRLVVRSGGLPDHSLEDLQRAAWPSLQQLELWFGDEDYGGCPSVEVAEPFLDSERLPQLRQLSLRNAMFTDDICGQLPTASILSQLTHLDLSMGTMSDEGAAPLLARPGAIAHLQRLDLRDNYISPRVCKQLSTLCDDVDTRFQRHHRADRYVSVGE